MKSFRATALSILLVFVAVVATPSPASHAQATGNVLRVAPNGATSGTCGGSWENTCDLQYALTTLAVAGDQLWVAQGTYLPTTGTDKSATFLLRPGIALYGGFAGNETSLDQRVTWQNRTYLSGDIGEPFYGDSFSYHVVTALGTDGGTLLDGLTITRGKATGEGTAGRGGGVYCEGCSLELHDVNLEGNVAQYIEAGQGEGGGIYLSNGSLVLEDVMFYANFAYDNGGGMLAYQSDVQLTNVMFHSNSSNGFGGGLYSVESRLAQTGGSYISNASHYGGAMAFRLGEPAVSRVTFLANHAYELGGGLYSITSSPVVDSALFLDNLAELNGGAISNRGGSLTVSNSIFSENTSPAAAVLQNTEAGVLALNYLTVTGNESGDGGGVIRSDLAGSLAVESSILWGNLPAGVSPIDPLPGGALRIAGSLVEGGCPDEAACVHVIEGDPLLGSSGSWGGDTTSIPLLPGSPAIDSGNCVPPVSVDQRGIARPQGDGCDMGAFESRGFVMQKTGGNLQSTAISSAFPQPLSVFLTSEYGEPVNGGEVTFTAPFFGAAATSTTSQATIANSSASMAFTANANPGSFAVTVEAAGVEPVDPFILTNTRIDTSVQLSASANPTVYGQITSLTAQVGGSFGLWEPSGSVQFKVDGQDQGEPVDLAGGSATIYNLRLSGGLHAVSAEYSGDHWYAPGTGVLDPELQVDPAPVQVAIYSTAPRVVYGQVVTFTAFAGTLDPFATGAPTGAVQFKADGDDLGAPVPLVYGMASLSVDTLDAGAYEITAAYAGDGNFAPGSATLADGFEVIQAAGMLVVSASSNPVPWGIPVTFTAMMSGDIQDGAFTFRLGDEPLPGCTDLPQEQGAAFCTFIPPFAGFLPLTVQFSGSTNYRDATAAMFLFVPQRPTAIEITSSQNPILTGSPLRLEVSVFGFEYEGEPAGARVELYQLASAGGIEAGQEPVLEQELVDGTAVFELAGLEAGSHHFLAIYPGDENYSPSVSLVHTQQVDQRWYRLHLPVLTARR